MSKPADRAVWSDDGRIIRQGREYVTDWLDDDRTPRRPFRAVLRFDDSCGNGHETFSLTADYPGGGGCCHEDIVRHFPQLAPLVKWHLCSTDGPLHYEANTVYLAGDRDYGGRRAGEPSALAWFVRFDGHPITHKISRQFAEYLRASDFTTADLTPSPVGHPRDGDTFGPKWTLSSYPQPWHTCPFNSEREAVEWIEALRAGFTVEQRPTAWSTGKARELDAARRAAIWPEATDAQLSADPDRLRAMLRERLPQLLTNFRAAMLSQGFAYPDHAEVL